MSYIKCKNCGSKVIPYKKDYIGVCEICSSTQLIPFSSDNRIIDMYNDAYEKFLNKDFENSSAIYKTILSNSPNECEAYFYLALCEYEVAIRIGSQNGNKVVLITSVKGSTTPFPESEYITALMSKIPSSIKEKYESIISEIEEKRIEAISKNDIFENQNEKSPLIIKAYDALKNSEWFKATELAEDEISTSPQSVYAHLIKLLAKLKVCTIEDISQIDCPFDTSIEYECAIKYSERKTAQKIIEYAEQIREKYNFSIYEKALLIENSTSIGAVSKAIELFTSIIDYRDSKERISKCQNHLEILQLRYSIFDSGAILAGQTDLRDAAFLYLMAEDGKMTRKYISYLPRLFAASNHSVFIQNDGKIKAIGENKFNQCNVESFCNIKSVACSYSHTLALTHDGRVYAAGSTASGKCDVNHWKDIIAIAAGPSHSVGLKSDGTVISVGYRHDERCMVDGWENIVSIKAGDTHTVGLKSDGTVITTGTNDYGQCNTDWKDIISISVGEFHTVGLTKKGKVVATGKNTKGECNVTDWEDIVGIAAGDDHTVGLKNDGTLVATGSNEFGQCNVNTWSEIVCVIAGAYHTIGLKADGSFVATGLNDNGRCDVEGIYVDIPLSEKVKEFIKDISSETDVERLKKLSSKLEKESLSILEEILEKEAVEERLLLEKEISDKKEKEQKKTENLENVKKSKAILEEKRNQERKLAEDRKQKGLCTYCGGTFKGVFTKKCSSCGKPCNY